MRFLTKSLYVAGHFCPALMWHQAHDPGSLPALSPSDVAMMAQGTAVGKLARRLYPEGQIVSGSDEAAAARTRELLGERVALFEATFISGRLLCKVDILLPCEDGGFDIVEVKASTSAKDEYVVDVAFQRHVLERSGVKVNRTLLMLLNRDFVRSGETVPEGIFALEDVSERVRPLLDEISLKAPELLETLDGACPHVQPGKHCFDGKCPVAQMLNARLEDHNVTQLYRHDGNAFLAQGIVLIAHIPQDAKLNEKQSIQRKAAQEGKPHVDAASISSWVHSLRHPIIHIDFETLNPAMPLWDRSRPFQHIPFQYSLHIEHEGGELTHEEFLHDGRDDPRDALLASLRTHLPRSGTLLAHNASFEKGVLCDLKEHSPADGEWIDAAIARLEDLIVPFRQFWYYDPAQRGSCSLKHVLPALTGKSYKGLAVSDGGMAQVQFARLIAEETSEEQALQIRSALLEYCGMDTQAMVDILRVLRKSCADK